MNTNEIFTNEHLDSYLKKFLRQQLDECNIQIRSANEGLQAPELLPENRTLHQRTLEVYSYRKKWLDIQLVRVDAPWLNDGQVESIINKTK